MGQSTDGILFYGFDLGDDEDLVWPWNDDENFDDWEDFVMKKLGFDAPTVDYEGNRKVYDEWWKKKREIIESLGCKIETHCSGEYPMSLVTISSKYKSARRGYPEEVTPGFMLVTSMEVEKLRRFCELLEIEWQEPKWMLTSYWG